MKTRFPILLPVSLLVSFPASAMTFYVAPSGQDSNPGTQKRPFATLQKAQQALRAAKKDEPREVVLRDGTYYLPDTLVLTAEDSGVTFHAYHGEKPVISGGQKLNLKWAPHTNGIWKAQVPADFSTDQLFINSERQILARYPNFKADERIFNGYAADANSPTRAARWADPTGGFLHTMHGSMWGGFHYIIAGKNEKGELTTEGGWQNNRRTRMHPEYRFVENIFEELDAPGEWFLDNKTHVLYYYPPAGLKLESATVEGARLKHLVELRGTEQNPVRDVAFKGITFRHTQRTFMENNEPLLRSDWTVYRSAAVLFNGAEDCSIEDSVLDQLGGNAIFVNNYNRHITIRGCHIWRAGGNGIAFVGDPDAVRNPLFEYAQRQNIADIDRAPGPKTSNFPAQCLVEQCLIHETGRVEKQTAPIEIDMAQDITVRHCSIYDVPRAGINIGDGAWGGHVIEFCDVFNTVLETGDHGSFNSWGRDRFWGLKGVDLNTVTLGEDKNLPLLDVVKPNILRNNRWRCDHGWDIDLDDGSSNYEITNNLCLNGGLKNREGFYRRAENNVIVNNSLHPHVWYGNSQDVFRRNIVFTPYKPIGMRPPWGKEVDYNLLHAAEAIGVQPAIVLQKASQADNHSIVANALFENPAKGNYRVKTGSPALALGFQNFPMDQFGVTKPELKAIAKTPRLPIPGVTDKSLASKRDATVQAWLGAQVRNIVGMGEMSAHGLPGETGVLLLEVPAGSALAAVGLSKNDVILSLNNQKVDTVADLSKATDKPLSVGYSRQQIVTTVTIR